MNEISVIDMFKAKVHFGHLKRFTSPKMFKYIHSINNKMSIINLDLTLKLMIRALNFIEDIIKSNGTILFVGTKRQSTKFIKIYADKINMPYVNFRWLGGLLTNFKTIKKSVDKLNNLEKIKKENNFKYLIKKEALKTNKRLNKLKLNLDGIKNMEKIPDAIFIIDVNYESIALLEAVKLSIPVIGVVDTNSNPDNVDYIIPGNDDSVDAINFYLNVVCKHILSLKKITRKNI